MLHYAGFRSQSTPHGPLFFRRGKKSFFNLQMIVCMHKIINNWKNNNRIKKIAPFAPQKIALTSEILCMKCNVVKHTLKRRVEAENVCMELENKAQTELPSNSPNSQIALYIPIARQFIMFLISPNTHLYFCLLNLTSKEIK